ncbi:MAG: glutathione S-transferase family protein [Leptolyngbya sp. UWPOB_LEPTO1]|uniref:glutathione S-transferase family protein n=1 Tax=Leptolyngbya sp. UWPOB_LEPTO1 TaxID=2815653 RepID=UPI001AC1D05A|nr:glutathione S-transferase family protein [Leptolyngbya sp. UWPOB_LEPTO1]MBN8565099.1 glutathione S-transferase family protein [Leptolyngbya sp. UWPOB_LEPTO1]
MSDLELYSAIACPFAHRSQLTLVEKQISFTLIELDLQNKPANFSEISPFGKIPVLKHGHHRIWESSIINEYLEEVFPSPSLLPQNAIHRAQARIWIQFADARLFEPTHQLLLTQDLQQRAKLVNQLTESLQWIEQTGLAQLSAAEPYWLGASLSLVDLAYYPWFEQIVVLKHFRGFQLPRGLDRLKRWWKTMANRQSVQSVAKPPDFHLEHYGRLQQLQPH